MPYDIYLSLLLFVLLFIVVTAKENGYAACSRENFLSRFFIFDKPPVLFEEEVLLM